MLATPRACSKNVLGPIVQCRNKEFILKKKSKSDFFLNQGVYVLQVDSDRYYVGKSHNIANRIEQHTRGEGSCFVKRILRRIAPNTSCPGDWESWERAETLHWMYTRGIHNVRGWMYTSMVLTPEQHKHAFEQICEKYDLCRQCGQKGHFIKECVEINASVKPFWFRL